MFGTIRKHQSWLWAIIITGMIITLVFFFSPAARTGNGSSSGNANFGSIGGVPIAKEDFMNAQRESALAYLIANGTWPGSGPQANNFDPQRETYQWLFFRQKLKDYNIHVDSESVARMANNILEKFGNGRSVPLDAFVQQVLMPRANAEDFERYVRDYLGLQQLISVVGLSGDLITEKEARSLYVRENQERLSEVVFFSGTNYLTSVPAPTPEVLGEFYTNQMSAYRLPERVQVSYIAFEATNFMAQAEREKTNLTGEIEMNLTQLGTNFIRIAKTPEEAKTKIREILIERQALADARQRADEFATTLFDINPERAENLALLARTNGLQVKVTAPFDDQTGPAEFDGGPNFARDAFKLSAEEPFGGPLAGEHGVYIFALNQRVPSEVPPLTGIHDRVVADYKRFQAAANARRAGTAFNSMLTNGLATGKNFAEIVRTANLKAVTLPPISLATHKAPELNDHVSFNQFRQVLFEVQLGKASEFIPTAEGGFMVYIGQMLPIDEAKMNRELPAFLKEIRQARRSEAINFWLQRESSKSLRDTPLMQPKPLVSGQGKS